MNKMAEKATRGAVCVTGAGGYVASWLVKLLLSHDYTVHGTVRDPHLLDYNSICAATTGCNGVFHVASPVPSSSVPNPEVELVELAVKGTLNVPRACSEANIKRVVYVSSAAAVGMNPNWPKGQVMDETCWSDKEYCRSTNNWYCLSKTAAESEAWEYAKRSGLDLLSVCPTLVLGPMLQHTVNASSLVLVKLLKEGYEELENKVRSIVYVRDVAEALLLAYEKPEAEGRYICVAHIIRSKEMVGMLRKLYPDYKYLKNFIEGKEGGLYTSGKLQRLGWRYRPFEETLADSIESYKKLGILN